MSQPETTDIPPVTLKQILAGLTQLSRRLEALERERITITDLRKRLESLEDDRHYRETWESEQAERNG